MGLTVAGHSSAAYLLPGMSVKIKASHFFVKNGTVTHQYQDGTVESVSLTHGFVLDDEEVGSITAVTGEPAIIYEHNKFESNMITFYALTGEKGVVTIMSVPIHDHSSIIAGGPAYGTFFTDDETVDSEI